MGKVKKKLALRNKITDKKQDSYPIFCFKYLMNEPKCDPKNRVGFYAEIKDLVVFRATGDNRAFLGIRNDDIFHIVFIEENFGDVYEH